MKLALHRGYFASALRIAFILLFLIIKGSFEGPGAFPEDVLAYGGSALVAGII